MVEFGRRMDLDDKTTLRAYAAFGLRYTPDNTHRIDASFANATADNGTFTDRVRSPELLGKVDLGLQMFRAGGLEIKAGYSADFSSSFLSQSANIRLGYYF
ncbi:Autotransporter domain-containing protein [Bordetella tumulicola]